MRPHGTCEWPLFQIGLLTATPAALDACRTACVTPYSLLDRHLRGDWGEITYEDRCDNDFAVHRALTIYSLYTLPTCECVLIITDAERSATRILHRSEF